MPYTEKKRKPTWSIYANNPVQSKINRELLSQLRHYAEEHLPRYMVPAAFVLLENFPLTPNGKVDRRALPPPGRNRPELEERYVEPRTPIEERIAAIWSDVLGLDQVGIFDNFFTLGGHSLLATQLVFQISQACQVDIPLRILFATPTVVGLAVAVNSLLQGESLTPEIEPQEQLDLKREALLPPDIDAAGKARHSRMLQEAPGVILLTGATGYLGAYLLAALLQSTQADICCLVRAANLDDAWKKIQKTLQSYRLWQGGMSARIQPLVGDLAKPLFGLSTDQFRQLAQRIDVIYHCGAAVNFIYPYHLLKAANVLGTQDILRLACVSDIKPVHFVSTLSVFPQASQSMRVFQEDDPLDDPSGLSSGYDQTKWVADKLAQEARRRGIPVSIYRPGLIGGDSRTGVLNLKDMLWSQLKGCIQMQAVPVADIQLDISPVDYICKAIVMLSQPPHASVHTFHLFNCAPASWNMLINQARSLGYVFEEMPYDDWREALQQIAAQAQENALVPFLSTLKKERSNMTHAQIDDRYTREALTQAGIICPATEQLFPTYLAFLQESGFLPKPPIDETRQVTGEMQKNGHVY